MAIQYIFILGFGKSIIKEAVRKIKLTTVNLKNQNSQR